MAWELPNLQIWLAAIDIDYGLAKQNQLTAKSNKLTAKENLLTAEQNQLVKTLEAAWSFLR